MQTLTLQPYDQNSTTIRCRQPMVYIDGRRRRDLEVMTWETLPAPDFGRVRLALRGWRVTAQSKRLENTGALPPIGARVAIVPADSSGGCEFVGAVTGHSLQVSGDSEQLAAEAQHQLALELGRIISDRRHIEEGQAVLVKDQRVCFNAGRDGLASAETVAFGTREARLFDTRATARRWSVADALAYIIATSVPQDIETAGVAELVSLAGDLDPGTIDITGLTIGEALVRVAQRGGLVVRASRRGRGLVFYRPGRQGRSRILQLQPVGAKFSVAQSNLWQGQISIYRRPSRRGVLAFGDKKQYESTFELSNGWDPYRQTSRWRDFIRSQADNWPAVADVYRKWVLNEHGWYSDYPWYLPVHDFASISEEDFPVHLPRKFLPCLSADSFDQSMGIVVEVRCGSGANWRRWTGPVWVSGDECAIYLGGDALPSDFFQAAVADEAEVRVTATIVSDVRLSAEIPGDAGHEIEIVDLADRAAWRKIHQSSTFHGQEDLGQPAERDDSEMLEDLARRCADVASKATEAKVVLGWIDTSCHIGDLVERIDGRALELSSNPDSRPFVRFVRHDFESWTTQLTVTG